jgi:predicted nucleotide-binding protein
MISVQQNNKPVNDRLVLLSLIFIYSNIIALAQEVNMTLPYKTTTQDVIDLIDYLKTKPTGVTLEDAKKVIDTRLLDTRKLYAYRFWDILEKNADRLLLSDRGWRIARKPSDRPMVFQEIIRDLPVYFHILEFAYYQNLEDLSNIDAVVFWNKKFPGETSETDDGSKDQAACFFRFCEGANLGQMKTGRRGNTTRLALNWDGLSIFIKGDMENEPKRTSIPESLRKAEEVIKTPESVLAKELPDINMMLEGKKEVQKTDYTDELKRRVYITHGKNRTFINNLKELLGFGELEPVVSIEAPSVSKPVPDKVMDEMRSCGAAIIHVDDEQTITDTSGNLHVILNSNVLIEIGAAMALYGRRFILLVKDGVKLPSDLQGLFEVRYSSDTLDGETTIRLPKVINQLKLEPMPD